MDECLDVGSLPDVVDEADVVVVHVGDDDPFEVLDAGPLLGELLLERGEGVPGGYPRVDEGLRLLEEV